MAGKTCGEGKNDQTLSPDLRAQRPWLDHYGPALSAALNPRQNSTLHFFREALARAPEAEAIRYFDASISYASLASLSDSFAAWLAEQGIGHGDRVGIILQNVPHFIVAVLAVWKRGAIPVPGNPMYKARELDRIFADYRPAAVVCHDDHEAETRAALALVGLNEIPLTTVCAYDFQRLDDKRLLPPRTQPCGASDFLSICAAREGQKPAQVSTGDDGIGLILYTSGTTGVPKGAVLRHSSIAFNAEAGAQWMGITPQSRLLALAPLFHITGFTLHMAVAFAAGCSLSLQYRFQPETMVETLRTYRPTSTIAAITAYNAMMNCPFAQRADFASFEHVFTGGAPVAPALRDAIRERLGLTLLPVYGMTEAAGQTHHTPIGANVPVHAETGALAVGLPISSTEAKIVGEDGNALPPGVQGEIWIRGPQIMTGYWNKPEETDQALSDGWYRSGDIGVMDEAGWFYVVDRKKDMIIASGYKVWPREVEDVLLAHPAVREAAVVGAPDDYRGETVVAFVSPAPGQARPDQETLIAYCRDQLAAYKAPRRVIILDELPKTPTGKIQRAVMRTTLQGKNPTS